MILSKLSSYTPDRISRLSTLLERVIRDRGISNRMAAMEIGVAPIIVSNVLSKKRIPKDGDAAAKLQKYLGVSPGEYRLIVQFSRIMSLIDRVKEIDADIIDHSIRVELKQRWDDRQAKALGLSRKTRNG